MTLQVTSDAIKSTSYRDPQKDTNCRNSRKHAAKPKSTVSGRLGSRDRQRSSRHAVKLSRKASIEYSISNSHQPFPYALRDQLCRRCRVMDFCKLFSKGLASDVSKDSAADFRLTGLGLPAFGSSDDLARSRRCPFCRLLLDLVQRRSSIWPSESEGRQWSIELVSTDDALFNFERFPDFQPIIINGKQSLDLSRTSALYLVIRGWSLQCNILSDIAASRFPRYISICDSVSCVERTVFRSRQVPANQADFETLRKWPTYCARHEMCSKKVLPTPQGLRVIDVKHRRLVDAPEHCEYIALSSIWGGVPMPKLPQSTREACYCWDIYSPEVEIERSSNEHFVVCSCRSIQLPNNYPRTIEDSIELALALEYNYLWVDSICLSQDDLDNHITLTVGMNTIYEGAYLTIIAAAGVDAEAGLPGVTPNSRNTRQHFEVVEGMRLAVAMPTLTQQIAESRWASRAWTFQEGIMCQRYLIFTNQQIYWECRQAAFCEAVEEPIKEFPDMNELPSFGRVLGSSFMERGEFSKVYCRLVSDYSIRDLTYESDGLRAVSGVLRQLEISFGVEFVCGIPKDLMPDYLLWNHQLQLDTPQVVRRRASIPSWTWAGWSGLVEFRISTERSQEGIRATSPYAEDDIYLIEKSWSEISWSLKSKRARVVDLEWNPTFFKAGFSWTQNSTDNRILECETRIAVFKLFKAKWGMEIECTFTDSYLEKPPPGGYKKMLRRVQVHMDCNSSDSENYAEQHVEVMECGQYSRWTPLIRTSCFILLSWEGGVASRIGVGCVCSRAFENANPINKVVRLR